MSKLKATILIDRPPDQVFAELVNFNHWPRWQGGLASVEQVEDGPLEVGSQLKMVGLDNKPAVSTMEVTHLIPDKMLGLNSPGRPITWQGTFTIEPIENNSRLTLQFDIRAKGLAGIIADLIIRLTLQQELRTFKAIVESI
jgi:uncharacterized membrane protein